jgi:diamine N-acetyltransferase
MKQPVEPFGDGVVTLRLVGEKDLLPILAWRNRDEARVWFKTSEQLSLEKHKEWYARYLVKENDYFFIVEVDGVPAGQCAIYDIDFAAGSAEIGRFLVAPDKGGHGYMKRSCTEIVRFGMDRLRLPYLFLEVKEQNVRAMKIYLGCGFREEGRSQGLVRMSLGRPAAV